MKRTFRAIAAILLAGAACAHAQSLDDLNIQIHGYATQGFLYTTNNNILTTESSNGSPEWTEAVLSISSQPTPKLRVSVQGRYELLGNYANGITIDYADADYKVNDKFGVRFGKVKIPSGLFNEIQDIDPAYLWSLLPQSIYPISSRNGKLSLFGGNVYGTLDLEQFGKLDYRGWGGATELASSDGYFISFQESGLNLYSGLSGTQTGEALHWRTPIPGFMIGASNIHTDNEQAPVTAANGAVSGTANFPHSNQPDLFARYEKNKLMVAVEYVRLGGKYFFDFGGPPPVPSRYDNREEYAMASYHLTDKLTAGAYYSQSFDLASPLGPSRYQKDWDISGRYDFTQFLYAKAEEHFLNGTSIGYDANLNPAGLNPSTRLTVLKLGVSF